MNSDYGIVQEFVYQCRRCGKIVKVASDLDNVVNCFHREINNHIEHRCFEEDGVTEEELKGGDIVPDDKIYISICDLIGYEIPK